MFNERTHAYLIGLFYTSLNESLGEDGNNIFIQAVKVYANQRGKRMRDRATDHGLDGSFISYFTHSEWAPTTNETTVDNSILPDDYITKVYGCPWYAQFQEMGLGEDSHIYCSMIDKELVRGFNPDLVLLLEQTIHTGSCCTFRWVDAGIDDSALKIMTDIKSKYGNKNIMPFDYHCAHIFSAFSDVISANTKKSKAIINNVINKYAKKHGQSAMDRILELSKLDFNIVIDSL